MHGVYPVIMAGGVGTRFWPLSTPECPKQFLSLVDPKKTMIGSSIDRFSKIFKREHIWIVSRQNFYALLKKYAKGTRRSQWLLEPEGKNTAPCIGWAAQNLLKEDPDAIMVVSPSDHWISRDQWFSRDVLAAVAFVGRHPEALVTFGVKPEGPETGYGYIESRPGGGAIAPVKRFVEKPNVSRARRMIRQGNFLWNTGLFVWRADTILEEIKRHLPAVYRGLERLKNHRLSEIYKSFPAVSIDHGVLEKSKNVVVRKAHFSWADLGSWKALSQIKKSRAKRWISIDSKHCFVYAHDRDVATLGVSDLIVVDHPNGLLVCHREDSQKVKEVVKLLSR